MLQIDGCRHIEHDLSYTSGSPCQHEVKKLVARLAKKTGLHITVCHYQPGTSKWNKIENRLFSRITHNWRGRPLETYQTIVNLIANTTTTTGLTVRCELDPTPYPTKIKLTDQQKKSIPLARNEFHGDWNYAIESQLG